jgi:hypothetical protein
MRSVFVYLKNTERCAVASVMHSFAKSLDGREWAYPADGNTTLWIRYFDEYQSEFEPEELAVLVKALGQAPDVVLMADISGRIEGEKEARFFANTMLNAFSGVAYDGCNEHYWSLAEINADAKPLGLRFFDHQGWYDRHSGGRA